MSQKLSYSLRIEDANGIHTQASIFTAMIPAEQEHTKVTRGLAGKFVMNAKEFDAFVVQTRPHIIILPPELSDYGRDKLLENLGKEVHEMYELQPKQGTWDYPKWVLKEKP
jgi:hypothetical protein